MRADGFIRRFDDLGRIFIPRELRRQLFGTPEKSEGMPMEVFMDKDEIIIRKYEENKADDVCEWTQSGDMAISPHTFSKYKIKQWDGLYTLNICPHCGKKIKVVERWRD